MKAAATLLPLLFCGFISGSSIRTAADVVRMMADHLEPIRYVTIDTFDDQFGFRDRRKVKLSRAIYVSYNYMEAKRSDLTFVIGGNCEETLNRTLIAHQKEQRYDLSNRLVIIAANPCDLDPMNLLEEEFEKRSEMEPFRLWLAAKVDGSSEYSLFGAVHWNEASPQKVFSFGEFANPRMDPHFNESQLMSNEGAVFRQVTVHMPNGLPWDSLVFNRTGGEWDLDYGMSYQIWDYIAKRASMRGIYTEPVYTWGDGSASTGMVKEVAESRADIMATFLAHCCKRDEVIDYTLPIHSRAFWIYFRQPELTIDIYFTQFSKQFWLCVIVTTLGLQLVMALSTWIYSKLLRDDVRVKEAKLFGFRDILSWSLSFLSQQGYERDPNKHSQRVLFMTGYVFAMLCFCGFSANIISTLQQVRSLEDFSALMKYDPIKIVATYFIYFQVQKV